MGEITSILLVFPGLASSAGDLEYREIEALFSPRGKVYRFRQEVPQFSLRLSRLRGEYRTRAYREIEELRPALDMFVVLQSWREELSIIEREGILTFRRWAQDPFVVLSTGEWTFLLDSMNNRRMCDFFLPLEIAAQAGPTFAVRPTRLFLEGGNILRGRHATYVGQDMVDENVRRLGIEEAMVVAELRIALGVQDITLLGWTQEVDCLAADGGTHHKTRQPLFHIDLFVTPGGASGANGKDLLFVADSRWGAEALLSENEHRNASFPIQNLAIQANPDPKTPHRTPKILPSEAEPTAHARFDAVAEQLTALGHHVVRLPIFFYDQATFTWNNALIEITDQVRRVYLPSYQCPNDPECLNPSFQRLEALVDQVYRKEGFEVHWLNEGRLFRTLARQGGSLHCLVKVMARG